MRRNKTRLTRETLARPKCLENDRDVDLCVELIGDSW